MNIRLEIEKQGEHNREINHLALSVIHDVWSLCMTDGDVLDLTSTISAKALFCKEST